MSVTVSLAKSEAIFKYGVIGYAYLFVLAVSTHHWRLKLYNCKQMHLLNLLQRSVLNIEIYNNFQFGA